MFKRNIYIILLSFFVVTGLQSATVKLATYAEFNMQLTPDDSDKWLFEGAGSNPRGYFELKFDINVGKEFSLWLKTGASTDGVDFGVSDLHAKYLKNMVGDKGFELVAFADEDSHFYLNQPLLDFTGQTGAWINNPTTSGLYYNGWNVLGFDFTRFFLFSSGLVNSTTQEDKLGIGWRVRKDFLKGGVKLGLTGLYYSDKDGTTDRNYFEQGFDIDTSLLGPFSLVYEMGICRLPDGLQPNNQPISFKGELRGNFALFGGNFGQTGFLASVRYAGEDYSSWRGNGVDGASSNELVERLEWYYNFPLKAIYLKEVLVYSHSLTDGAKSHLWEFEFDPTITSSYFNSYTELYIEFINGFKFKTYLSHTEGGDSTYSKMGKWNNVLFQLEVENEFAKIKPMVLLLNIGDADFSATAFGGEVLINLSDKIKFYTRFAMVAGSEDGQYASGIGEKNWGTFFCELQFLKIFQSTDIYFTFGNGDHTNDDLVHDNTGVLKGATTEKRFNLSVKFWL